MENSIFDAPNNFSNLCYEFLNYYQIGPANVAPV